jgi:aspartyl-tRNA(Asn)/glutamyl-tRNA(Gln) amidotransferase subunit C
MERASTLIRGLRLPGGTLSGEELACAVWPQAAGKKIASHTRAARLVRTRLIIEVEDVIWQRQLNSLSKHMIRNLEQILGKGMVEDLEFRVVPRRRGPERAEQSAPALFDDSDAIADPVLRSIYRAARNVAGLANLQLTDTEVAKFQADLNGILEHMDKLNEIDTSGVEPMAQVLFSAGETATLRPDVVVPPLGNDAALANAPLAGAGYFKVPLVIER